MGDFGNLLRRGIRLPPVGWALAAMLAFYVLAGLFGRDPWKGEDAIHIGTTWNMLHHSDWLSPDLAGRPFHEPPLYYWTGALTGKALGWLLPLHEAIRLASVIAELVQPSLYGLNSEIWFRHRNFRKSISRSNRCWCAGEPRAALHLYFGSVLLDLGLSAFQGAAPVPELSASAVVVRYERVESVYVRVAVATDDHLGRV